MKYQFLFIGVTLFLGCGNKQASDADEKAPQIHAVLKPADQAAIQISTDTLQFIYFDGNYDYWTGVFLNSKKDTITLVTDSIIADELKNKLFQVKWFTDTLHEAGDDSRYAARRMTEFRVINGKPFVPALTEKEILEDIKNIPEVRDYANHVAIAERPVEGKEYYLIETGTREPERFARLYMLRVYVYPNYEIRMYDPAKDTELSLSEWRKQPQH